MIIGFGMLLIFGKQKSRRLIVYMTRLALLFVSYARVWHTIDGIYATTFNTETNSGSSYAYRFALQDAAVKRLSQDPTTRALWGYGPESFYLVNLEGPLLGVPHAFLSCDNAWVEFLVETGFVGLFIMVLLLLKPARVAWKGYWNGGPVDKHLSFILFLNLVIFYFQMYSVGMYSWGQNGYMLWIIIALVLSQPKWRESVQSRNKLSAASGAAGPVIQDKEQWENRNGGNPLERISHPAPSAKTALSDTPNSHVGCNQISDLSFRVFRTSCRGASCLGKERRRKQISRPTGEPCRQILWAEPAGSKRQRSGGCRYCARSPQGPRCIRSDR